MRKDVEEYFKYDGGMQFLPANARYVWTACAYLKLDVEYEPPPNRAWDLTSRKDPTSPEDRVRKVSKLYVDYPVTDLSHHRNLLSRPSKLSCGAGGRFSITV